MHGPLLRRHSGQDCWLAVVEVLVLVVVIVVVGLVSFVEDVVD